MKKTIYVFALLLLSLTVHSQISHGGNPLPLQVRGMRSTSQIEYIDMPDFNVKSGLRSLQNNSSFRSIDFAHKFYVKLRPDNSGEIFETNGYKVWRVAIRSKKAHSLNIFFSTFHIPEGGKLFIYNPSQTEILGSYTYKNNSDTHKLPIQPIPSDRIIIEYQEPLNADFRGKLEIGEVNHDYLGIFRAAGEPRDAETLCHSDLVCFPEDEQAGQGTVALVINGITYCSGSLLNNTKEDNTPYLLTASHCLNSQYAYTYPRGIYQKRAETMVVFFNYNSPVCGKKGNRIIDHFRGITQMSMASADSVLISEKHDIALLKLKDTPPEEYKASLLGWNAEDHPKGEYHGIHHPNGGVKKVSTQKGNIYKTSSTSWDFTPKTFWAVSSWDEGITEGGSSGSPLLDKNKKVIGSLTDGLSECPNPKGPDNYASLHSFWDVAPSLGNPNSISKYLDPTDSGRKEIDSKDMFDHDSAPYIINNFSPTDIFEPNNLETSPLFQTNGILGGVEYAEGFNPLNPITLHGIYIATSPMEKKLLSQMDVKIRIYTGSQIPETMIKEIDFKHDYKKYENPSFDDVNREMNHTVENYIKLDEPLRIKVRFFISFTEINGVKPGFSVLNVKGRNESSLFKSTAWIKEANSWTNAIDNKIKSYNTSLYISAHVKKDLSNAADEDQDEDQDERRYIMHYSKDSQKINIKSEYPIRRVSIYSITGQLIDERHIKSNRTELSIPFFMRKGLYAVRTVTDNKTHTDKILIE